MLELHGYPSSAADSEKMVSLTDLAITASPQVLRLIASFLHEIADDMGSGRLRNSHIHIGSRIPDWKKLGNGIDIQVINTNYEGPAIT